MNTEDKPKFELDEKAGKDYKAIQYLYRRVNIANKIHRNHACICGSGRKWKKCCITHHEADILRLEHMIKDYRNICREINRRRI